MAVGLPTFRHCAALHAGPRTALVVLPPVVLHACCGLCVTPRRLLTCGDEWKVNVKSASGGHRLREHRGVSVVLGFARGGVLPRGGCRRSGRSPRLAPEATRNLAGVQQATALVDAEFNIRLLHPRQNPGRASPARRGERPNLRGDCLRCAVSRSRSPVSMLNSALMEKGLDGVRWEI